MFAPALASGGARAAFHCSLYAAPHGSDRASGGLESPFASVQRLIGALRPGQVGCLRGGIYAGNITVARGGEPGRPLTLTSYPGERMRVIGRLYIRVGADHLVFSRLGLDGRNALALPSPTVLGSDVAFLGDNVTNWHTSICFDLGQANGPVARHIAIERSVIHDCGRLPADNHEHGIYVENTRDARIAWNLIFANADRGIQLYPDAQATSIVHNVIYGNGEGILFAGAAGTASSGALVTHNAISGSDVRSNVESWYPAGAPIGRHNLVTKNCIGASHATPVDKRGGGFDASHNLMAQPLFADPAVDDFEQPRASPCLSLTGDVSGVVAAAL